MVSYDDIRAIAAKLPGVVEGEDEFGFSVLNKGKHKGMAWLWKERIEPKKARVPNPDILAVRVANEEEKQMLLASDTRKFFTEPHYNGYPAVMVRLAEIDFDEMAELLTEAWRCQAPRKIVEEFDLSE